MTREEAKEILLHSKMQCEYPHGAYGVAVDMAIKALEQEPCREQDDYENEIEDLHNRLDIAEYDKERLREEVTQLEEKIKALEQEPKFIAKADGTIEQIKNCEDCLFKKEWEKIGKLISVVLEKQTEQEPKTDGDAISRVEVFEQINCWIGSGEYCYKNAIHYLWKRIKELQSVNPQKNIVNNGTMNITL